MNRDELLTSIAAARPGRDDLVYLQRRGDDYDWQLVAVDTSPSTSPSPDVWMSFSADWPVDDPERLRAFFDDVMAELDCKDSTVWVASRFQATKAGRAGVDGGRPGSVSLADRRTLAPLTLTGRHRGLSNHSRGPGSVQALQAAVGFRIAESARSRIG